MLQDGIELARIDREPRARPIEDQLVHPGQPAQPIDRLDRLDDNGRAGQVAELVERSRLGGSTGTDDRDSITEGLDLGEDVAGEQNRASRGAHLAHDVLEDDLHQRIET
jgi:hypothetical protein